MAIDRTSGDVGALRKCSKSAPRVCPWSSQSMPRAPRVYHMTCAQNVPRMLKNTSKIETPYGIWSFHGWNSTGWEPDCDHNCSLQPRRLRPHCPLLPGTFSLFCQVLFLSFLPGTFLSFFQVPFLLLSVFFTRWPLLMRAALRSWLTCLRQMT